MQVYKFIIHRQNYRLVRPITSKLAQYFLLEHGSPVLAGQHLHLIVLKGEISLQLLDLMVIHDLLIRVIQQVNCLQVLRMLGPLAMLLDALLYQSARVYPSRLSRRH